MAKRETSKDLRKKHTDALSKLKGLESRIQQRASEMVQKQPEIIYGYDADQKKTPVTVKQMYDEFNLYVGENFDMKTIIVTEVFLDIIQKIEEYNEEHANIKQGKLF